MRPPVRRTAESIVGLLLACWKGLPELLRAERWEVGGKDRTRLLADARILILGGQPPDGENPGVADVVALLLGPTGARLSRGDGCVAPVVAQFAQTDALVILPGAPLVQAAAFDALPVGAVVVVATDDEEHAVDLEAVTRALISGRLAAAGLIFGEHDWKYPRADHAMWTLPNAIVQVRPADERS